MQSSPLLRLPRLKCLQICLPLEVCVVLSIVRVLGWIGGPKHAAIWYSIMNGITPDGVLPMLKCGIWHTATGLSRSPHNTVKVNVPLHSTIMPILYEVICFHTFLMNVVACTLPFAISQRDLRAQSWNSHTYCTIDSVLNKWHVLFFALLDLKAPAIAKICSKVGIYKLFLKSMKWLILSDGELVLNIHRRSQLKLSR